MSKVAQTNSNSSNRQKAAFIKPVVGTENFSEGSLRSKRKITAREAQKQANNLEVVHPNQDKHITHEVIKSTIVFVDGEDHNNP